MLHFIYDFFKKNQHECFIFKLVKSFLSKKYLIEMH